LARLLDLQRAEVEADPLAAVRAGVAHTGCTVLLKGATQYVATPGESRVWIGIPGPGWTAQAGSGDVLAGACGALLAAGLTPAEAALAATSVQALAALGCPGPIPPQTLAERFRVAVVGLGQN
jgi:NAD(P)H-hydrate repair Nnr-like enzyme with NAD(P)H-hydrate dehydratase domain